MSSFLGSNGIDVNSTYGKQLVDLATYLYQPNGATHELWEPTTTRISVGLEDPRMFIAHMQRAAMMSIDLQHPEFSKNFPDAKFIDKIYQENYQDVHARLLPLVQVMDN